MKSFLGNVISCGSVCLGAFFLSSCSTPTSGTSVDDDDVDYHAVIRSSSSVSNSSSSVTPDSSSTAHTAKSIDSLVDLVDIPATDLSRSGIVFSVDGFAISKTEVTQSLYKMVVGEVPQMVSLGDNIPVAEVNWYDAALFCNALSVLVGLDTAYVYESVGNSRYLKNLTIKDGVKAVRLPTETEWEIAYRAGTTTTYYWNTAQASKYAYYIQENGPTEVGQYLPNGYGLYDMGGNVAEWTNDWYGTYPTKSVSNYKGPDEGDYRVVRGGGWSDKATALAANAREKKDPLYQSETLGFRIVVIR